jgi:DNA-binding NarL/FixJ family response regulator
MPGDRAGPPRRKQPYEGPRDAAPGVRTTVLIVDDHCGFRYALESLLASAGDLRLVGSVCTGAEAVTLSEQLEPRVVIMDLAMPGINGVEATRRICGQRRPPAVVALSGSRELWREAGKP